MSIEKLEERAYAEQEDMIREMYGVEAADKANYGWGVDDDGDEISICTKVYGIGVLNTVIDPCTHEISHDMDEEDLDA